MGIYAEVGFGTNLSDFVTSVEVQHEAMRGFERGSTEPSIKVDGQLWLRTDYPTLLLAYMRWDQTAGAWKFLIDPDFGQINAGGTIEYAADQPMDGYQLTDLGACDAAGKAARYEEVFADTTGRMKYNAACTVQTDAAPTTTFEPVGFVPRKIFVRLFGDVTDQGTSTVLGTIDEELEFTRWDADAGAGFGGTGGVTEIASVTVGADTVKVFVEPKYTAVLGFWLSLENQTTGNRCDVEMAQMQAYYGLGQ